MTWRMKSKKLGTVFGVLLGMAVTSVLVAQESALNTVRFTNETGFEIAFLFFSPGDSEFWGPDLLGADTTLRDGEWAEFYVHYPESCGSFDFMAIDTDGDAYLIWDYQICDGRRENVEITLDAFQGSAPELSFTELRLVNQLPYELFYLFLSPGDSGIWGVDYLSSEGVLQSGRVASFLVPVMEEQITYDVIAVDNSSEIYSFSIDLDSGRELYEFPVELSDLQE